MMTALMSLKNREKKERDKLGLWFVNKEEKLLDNGWIGFVVMDNCGSEKIFKAFWVFKYVMSLTSNMSHALHHTFHPNFM